MIAPIGVNATALDPQPIDCNFAIVGGRGCSVIRTGNERVAAFGQGQGANVRKFLFKLAVSAAPHKKFYANQILVSQ